MAELRSVLSNAAPLTPLTAPAYARSPGTSFRVDENVVAYPHIFPILKAMRVLSSYKRLIEELIVSKEEII